MEFNSIVEIALGSIVAVMGYFLKVIHSDVRQNTKDVGENKGRISNVNTQIEHEREMRGQTFDSIMSILNEIKEQLNKMRDEK